MRDSVRILGLGAVAGMRSMAAPALLESHLHLYDRRAARRLRRGRMLLRILAVGELVADKLPWTPPRIRPASLSGRALSGALVGGALAYGLENSRGSVVRGALLGAGAAAASSWIFYRARSAASRRFHLPGPVVGVIEDGVALAAGARLLRSGF